MSARDYVEFDQYSTPSKERMLLKRNTWGKIQKANKLNAPAEKAAPTKDEVSVRISPSTSIGAELAVNVVDIMNKYGLVVFDSCEDGLPVQYTIPARRAAAL